MPSHVTRATLVALVAAVGCGRPAAEEAGGATESPGRIVEIPVTTTSEPARAAFEEGQRLLDVGRFQEANAAFKRAVEADPDFVYGYVGLAGSAASTEELKGAIDRAAARLEGVSDGERLLVELNRTFLDNDADHRLTTARQLVEGYPASPRAWLELGNARTGRNENLEAREAYARAIELDPSLFAAHAAAGFNNLFTEPKDFAAAQRHMEAGIEILPDEAKAYENLGDVLRARQELERARDAYSTAVEIDPDLSVARLKKGHINSFLGNLAEARADYDAGVAGATEANRIFYANYRAFTHLHADEPAAAIEELLELAAAADTMPGVPAHQVPGAKIFTLTNAGTVALHAGLLDEAERIVDRLGEVMRTNAQRVGDPDFTRQQEAAYRLWRGQLAARRNDLETARAEAAQNRRLLGEDANPRKLEGYHDLLGLIALRENRCGEAVEHYRQANLQTIYAKYHLARARECAGDLDQARRLYREVADWNFNSVGYALVRRDARQRAERRGT